MFLGEGLEPLQIAGTGLLLFAIVLISKKHRIGTWRFDRYFLLMLSSGIMLGVALTAERALQRATGFTAGTMMSWWAQCLCLGIAAYLAKSPSEYGLKDTMITGVLRFLQSLSWVILLAVVGNLSLVSAVTTFKVVVIFVAAAILLKEREDMHRKILGSVIAVIGLLLMK
jgi:drug/metabolite transporter (DMT)-like permease